MKKINNAILTVLATLFAIPAFAQEAVTTTTASANGGLIALGAAFVVGVAALGGALGQGRTVSAAMDGIARNPSAQQKMFVPMLIGLALMEALVILCFVIALQLVGKI